MWNDKSACCPFVFLFDLLIAATGSWLLRAVRLRLLVSHTGDEWWNCPSTYLKRSRLKLSIITVNTLVICWCQNLVLAPWCHRLLQMFSLVNHMNTTTSQFIKKVNCWTVPFVLSCSPHLPSFSTLTYTPPAPCPNIRTHTPSTLSHTPTTLHVSGRQGERRIKEWGTSEVEQKKHQWFPNLMTSCHQLHCTFSSTLLWISGESERLRLSISFSQTHTHFHTLWASCSCDCSSGPSPALLSQYAAPAGVSSPHGGSVQR